MTRKKQRRFGSTRADHKWREKQERQGAAYYARNALNYARRGDCVMATHDAIRAAALLGRAAAEKTGGGNRITLRRDVPRKTLQGLTKAVNACFLKR